MLWLFFSLSPVREPKILKHEFLPQQRCRALSKKSESHDLDLHPLFSAQLSLLTSNPEVPNLAWMHTLKQKGWVADVQSHHSPKALPRTDGIIGSLKDCSVSLCSITYGTTANRKSISMSCTYKLPPPPRGAELCQCACWKMECYRFRSGKLRTFFLAGLKWKSGYFTLMTHDEVSFGI